MNDDSYPVKLGTLWRYSGGSTALVQVDSLHQNAKGYHGAQCCGGSIFVGHDRLEPASLEDYKTWFECEHWRKP